MPSLRRITYEQFKGVTDTIVAEKLNLLVGPNGTGKTGRLLGPQFAVMGTTPVGDRPEAALKFGGPAGCAVTVELDDGFTWTRGVQRDPVDLSAKSSLSIVGHESLGVRKADAEIKHRVGDFAPMFDLGAFLSLSDDKRRDFVLDLCARAHGDAALDPNDIALRIYVEVLKAQLGEGTVVQASEDAFGVSDLAKLCRDERTKLVHQLAEKLPDGWCDALAGTLEAVRDEIKGEMTAAIGAALAKAKELASAGKRAADEADQAVRRLSQQKSELQVVAETAQQLKARRAELEKQKEKAAGDMAAEVEREEARNASRDAIDRLSREIVQRQQELKTAGGTGDAGDSLDRAAELDDRAEQLEAKAAEPVEDITSQDASREAADLALRAATKTVLSTEREQARAIRTHDEVKSTCERAAGDPWRKAVTLFEVLVEAVRGALDADENASGAANELGDHLRKNCRHGGDIDELFKAEKRAEKAVEDLRRRVEEDRRIEAQAKTALQKADAALAATHARVRDAERARAQAQAEVRTLRMRAHQIRDEHAGRSDRDQRLRAEIATKAEERDARQAELNRLGNGSEIYAEAKSRKAGYEQQIAELDGQIQGKERLAALETALAGTIRAAERDKVEHEACKAVVNGIKALRDSVVAELVAPLLTPINRFLTSSVLDRHAYCRLLNDRDRVIFELGWSDGERRIPLEAMSGGETAMFGAALAYALVTLAGPPVKLLLIEAAELDDDNLAALLNAIRSVGDDIDNALVATCNMFFAESAGAAGWNVIELGTEIPMAREGAVA